MTRATLKNDAGSAQVDLLIDVDGGAVYLFELKFCDRPYTMTADESAKLLHRRKVLNTHFKAARSIIVCLLAPNGTRKNTHLDATVDLLLDWQALWKPVAAG